MSGHLHRGVLLLQQGKAALAESEFRAAIAESPDDPVPHALLSLCLSERALNAEATEEAERAIVLGPDLASGHAALARALLNRNRADEAEGPAREAARLDPSDADHRALLSWILFRRERWDEALAAADSGLELDAEHDVCRNLRAMALVKLGRRDEAGRTLDGGIEKNPEDALTHANQGWLLLERRDPRQALVHFREALRLDPNNEFAQAGLVEALKARFFVYRWFLSWMLWMARLGAKGQWLFILGLYAASRILGALGRTSSPLAPLFRTGVVLYVAFVALTWFAVPLSNLALFVHRTGRLALSRDQYRGALWFGLHLGAFGGALAAWAADVPFAALASLGLGFTLIPAAAIFRTPSGWPRRTMALYTAGCIALFLASLGVGLTTSLNSGKTLMQAFFWACILSWLPANLLASASVKT